MKNELRPKITGCCARFTLLGCVLAITVSCASTKQVNYRAYQKIPDTPTSFVMRTVLKSNPYTRKRAFNGQYGGSGNLGGLPASPMDEVFRRHDIVYYEARTLRSMKEADRMLIRELEALDESVLTEEEREYRIRAVKYMKSPMAGIVGKPVSVLWRWREPKRGYFQEREDVIAFFDDSHQGFPDEGAVPGAAETGVMIAAPAASMSGVGLR